MTLTDITIYMAIAGGLWTALVIYFWQKSNQILITFLQSFCSALFIFSGWVKAIDPLGTAYKMEQYFAEFKVTFSQTSLKGIADIFPVFAEYAIVFAVIMIVLEIVLGIMLLFGIFQKFTAWTFFLLILFFTFLTGFTYLTGYVPEGVNFFSFSQWGDYVETNMKVTDCGCFGDFIKLKPKVSFLKDIFLLIPAILFILFNKSLYSLFSNSTRNSILIFSLAGFTFYSFSNFVWNLPHTDFRPFKIGNNLREMKKSEKEAAAAVKIVAYKMTNLKSGKVVEVPFDTYMVEYAKYPTSDWKLEQIKSEPTIEKTKVSDFEVADIDGNDKTEEILNYPGFSFMIIAYKLKESVVNTTKTQRDSLFRKDSLLIGKTYEYINVFDKIEEKTIPVKNYSWDESYLDSWNSRLLPVMNPLVKQNIKIFAITKYTDKQMIHDFQEKTGANFPIYMADDILLKTIVRSNPGVVLLKDGKVIANWHIRKLPHAEELITTFGLKK
jgi:uncharacterized membrane protein YphA (DoxX/SURF4 family)